MSEIIAGYRVPWIAAESDPRETPLPLPPGCKEKNSGRSERARREFATQHPPRHQFPAASPRGSGETGLGETPANANPAGVTGADDLLWQETALEAQLYEHERRRRVYRGRTAGLLQRYMRYALETGRIPSILGSEFFRSQVTSYSVTTFEDRAIFVHDMEKCLQRLDEMSKQVLARVVLQGYGRDEAARLLGCTRMTIHRNLREALDRMADILLGVGLLEVIPAEETPWQAAASPVKKSCQGGEATDFLLSDCEDGK
jgi:DNA-directed RNA polymerase specialized sigma24 family protein